MSSKRRSKPDWVKKLALAKVNYYLNLAEKVPKHASRYYELAKKFCLKYKIKPDRMTCRKCGSILVPGRTLQVRTSKNKNLVLKCMKCGSKRKKSYATPKRPSSNSLDREKRSK